MWRSDPRGAAAGSLRAGLCARSAVAHGAAPPTNPTVAPAGRPPAAAAAAAAAAAIVLRPRQIKLWCGSSLALSHQTDLLRHRYLSEARSGARLSCTGRLPRGCVEH